MAIDFDTTPIPCKHCENGLVHNNFTGDLDLCKKCDGDATIFVCHSFTTTKPTTWMATECDQCAATKSQHMMVGQYEELVKAE